MNITIDKEFYKTLVKLAVPIALQNFISSSLNMVDAIMVGQLGETAIAGVGIANQIFFLMNLVQFGTYSGACIFAAQYWGKGDVHGVRTVLGQSLKIGCSISLVFTLVSVLFPRQVLGLFSEDPAVIELGAQFLVLNALSFVIFAITFGYTLLCRSTGHVRLPLVTSVIALSVNTLLNYLLINGNLGFPAMGVRGAGVATLISRVLEAAFILIAVYAGKYPVAAGLKELFSFSGAFLKRFLKTTAPVILHEGLWSLGMTMYTVIYAHMGTGIIAAMNIASTIEKLSLVLFFGIGNACAIMVGHKIGENKALEAQRDAGKLLVLGPAIGVVAGLILVLTYGVFLSLFHVSGDVKHSAGQILIVMALLMPIRIFNLIMIVGITRAGGDTRFSLLMEITPLWLIAIPLAAVGGLYFKLPILPVYLLAGTEEFIKAALGLKRFFSRKWIHNVV